MLMGMAVIPQTVYARDGDVNLAYQVAGSSGPDLLFIPTPRFPIDLIWDDHTVADHLRRLGSFGRLILTDLLGVGSSDAVAIHERPAMQAWTDGLIAVLDAAGSERASVFGMAGSALPAMLLAASHPERVRSLVLWSPYAYFLRTPDQPFAIPERALNNLSDVVGQTAGTGAALELLAPSWSRDVAKRRWYGRGERLAGGRGYFKAVSDLFQHTDMRPVLESIQAPTLVVHRRGDRFVVPGHAKYVAERIPHTRRVEFDGDDHEWFAGDSDLVLDEIGSFLTGARRSRPSNRVLSTVLFTDIVGSTERATALGDHAWNSILNAHNQAVERRAMRAARSSSSPATVHSRHSTVRLGQSTAHAQFETLSGISACIFAPDCTRVRWRSRMAMCMASRSISRRGSWGSHNPTRFWYPAPSRRWCWDPGSRSTTAAVTY
jgi:pimeloyl-ACP methyl ester carboxylesterase